MKEVLQKFLLVTATTLLFLSGCMTQPAVQSEEPLLTRFLDFFSNQAESDSPAKYVPPNEYWPSSKCRNCHEKTFEDYSQSMHAQSFTNPVFEAQYFNEVLPLTDQNNNILLEAKKCIACHAPIAFLKNNGFIVGREQVDPLNSGVTCDFCHTISGYEDESPGNGNYISTPAEQKLGPFICETNWHHEYCELQTKSEFCAICHNAVNHYGLEIKSTYTEWKASRYAEEGIECQDCHMNIQGFLTAGKPTYESGEAVRQSLCYSSYRPKLYTHRFPGAHSKTQVIGALTLGIEFEETNVSPGNEIKIDIHVDNSRTGHKMPSGSADLRLLWLDVRAIIEGRVMSVPAISEIQESRYDISGLGPFDREIISDDVPPETRVYRAIFVDKTGKQTLSSYEAVKITFDNRLDAAEIRQETYHFTIPKDVSGKVLLVAQLQYLPYPSSFANRFSLPSPEAVVIATAKKEIIID